MRFLCLYKPAKPEGTPPSEKDMADMGKLITEMKQAGVLLATEGCLPSAAGARVRQTGVSYTVKDGPFTESKELVAGMALLQVKSKAECIEWTKQFLKVAGDGECEVRQIFDGSDCVPG